MTKCEKLEPGLFYHIYNRGNNCDDLFIEEKNYSYFLRLWKKHVGLVADTYGYSLLKNHFRFFIRINSVVEIERLIHSGKKAYSVEKRITLAFSNFFNSYAKSINSNYDRTGSLFQERFRRKLIDSEENFTRMMLYIHANAQKHGFAEDFFYYPYSSFLEILSGNNSFVRSEEVLQWFGGRSHYIEFHRNYREELIRKVIEVD